MPAKIGICFGIGRKLVNFLWQVKKNKEGVKVKKGSEVFGYRSNRVFRIWVGAPTRERPQDSSRSRLIFKGKIDGRSKCYARANNIPAALNSPIFWNARVLLFQAEFFRAPLKSY